MTEKRFKKLCALAEKISLQCRDRYRVVAIVYDKNKVISTGVNTSNRSYPFLKRYFIYATIHAEIAALIPIIHFDNFEGLDIFVYCANSHKKLRNSKPCPMCVEALYDSNKFKNAYWTDGSESWDGDKIENLHKEVMKMNRNMRYFCNGNPNRLDNAQT